MLYELKSLRAKVQELKHRLEVISQHSGHVDRQIERLVGTPAHASRAEGVPPPSGIWTRMPPGQSGV